MVVVARPERMLLAEAKEDYGRNLAAISQLRRQHAHGTPFRELVRALDRAECGEALASLPGRGGFPHELEAEVHASEAELRDLEAALLASDARHASI